MANYHILVLEAGNYYFVETAAPAGYTLDETKHSFTISGDSDATIQPTVEVSNEAKLGAVKLTKTDSDSGKTLAGATFTLFKADGTKVAEDLNTKEDGTLTVSNLKPGNYYFLETAAPAGYEFDKDKSMNSPLSCKPKQKLQQFQ